MGLAFLASCSYCYTETGTGTANTTALQWTMSSVLPNYTGLTITSLTYRYTVTKAAQDSFAVTVQNTDTQGGYIFRSLDNWTGRPGNTITKTFALEPTPAARWGVGSITAEGRGEVSNPYVLYGYRYDTCSGTVIVDPKCPGYKPSATTVAVVDPLDDELVKAALESKKQLVDAEEEQRRNRFALVEPAAAKKSPALSKTVQNGLVTAEAISLASALESLNNLAAFMPYYAALPGGVYQDVLKYADKKLPDARNSVRLNLAQQQLHTQLVNLQYAP